MALLDGGFQTNSREVEAALIAPPPSEPSCFRRTLVRLKHLVVCVRNLVFSRFQTNSREVEATCRARIDCGPYRFRRTLVRLKLIFITTNRDRCLVSDELS